MKNQKRKKEKKYTIGGMLLASVNPFAMVDGDETEVLYSQSHSIKDSLISFVQGMRKKDSKTRSSSIKNLIKLASDKEKLNEFWIVIFPNVEDILRRALNDEEPNVLALGIQLLELFIIAHSKKPEKIRPIITAIIGELYSLAFTRFNELKSKISKVFTRIIPQINNDEEILKKEYLKYHVKVIKLTNESLFKHLEFIFTEEFDKILNDSKKSHELLFSFIKEVYPRYEIVKFLLNDEIIRELNNDFLDRIKKIAIYLLSPRIGIKVIETIDYELYGAFLNLLQKYGVGHISSEDSILYLKAFLNSNSFQKQDLEYNFLEVIIPKCKSEKEKLKGFIDDEMINGLIKWSKKRISYKNHYSIWNLNRILKIIPFNIDENMGLAIINFYLDNSFLIKEESEIKRWNLIIEEIPETFNLKSFNLKKSKKIEDQLKEYIINFSCKQINPNEIEILPNFIWDIIEPIYKLYTKNFSIIPLEIAISLAIKIILCGEKRIQKIENLLSGYENSILELKNILKENFNDFFLLTEDEDMRKDKLAIIPKIRFDPKIPISNVSLELLDHLGIKIPSSKILNILLNIENYKITENFLFFFKKIFELKVNDPLKSAFKVINYQIKNPSFNQKNISKLIEFIRLYIKRKEKLIDYKLEELISKLVENVYFLILNPEKEFPIKNYENLIINFSGKFTSILPAERSIYYWEYLRFIKKADSNLSDYVVSLLSLLDKKSVLDLGQSNLKMARITIHEAIIDKLLMQEFNYNELAHILISLSSLKKQEKITNEKVNEMIIKNWGLDLKIIIDILIILRENIKENIEIMKRILFIDKVSVESLEILTICVFKLLKPLNELPSKKFRILWFYFFRTIVETLIIKKNIIISENPELVSYYLKISKILSQVEFKFPTPRAWIKSSKINLKNLINEKDETFNNYNWIVEIADYEFKSDKVLLEWVKNVNGGIDDNWIMENFSNLIRVEGLFNKSILAKRLLDFDWETIERKMDSSWIWSYLISYLIQKKLKKILKWASLNRGSYEYEIFEKVCKSMRSWLILKEIEDVIAKSKELKNDISSFKVQVFGLETENSEKTMIRLSKIAGDCEFYIDFSFNSAYPIYPVECIIGPPFGISPSSWLKLHLGIKSKIQERIEPLSSICCIWSKLVYNKMFNILECLICCYVSHPVSKSIPSIECPICQSLFHADCIYKWFVKSGKSSCPHCRSII